MWQRRCVLCMCVLAVAMPCTGTMANANMGLGESIFRYGIGRDGREVSAHIGEAGISLSGGAVACANCHGEDGAGGGESFVRAPDIRWYALSKPYGAVVAGGAIRSGYDLASVSLALRTGRRSDAQWLDPAMPRFDLADDEIRALVQYLTELQDADSSSSEASPALLFVLPTEPEPLAEQLLEGIQNCPKPRMADGDNAPPLPAIRVMRYEDAAQAAVNLGVLTQKGEVAAAIAPYLIGREAQFVASLGSETPPLLLPIVLFEPDWPARVEARFVLPGLMAQVHALLESADSLGGTHGTRVIGVYYDSANAGSKSIAQKAVALASERGWQATMFSDRREFPHDARAWLGVAPLPSLADVPETPPTLLLPSAFVSSNSIREWHEKGSLVRVAMPYPTVPGRRPVLPTPVKAWTAIACELLKKLPPLPQTADGLAHWRFQLESIELLDLSPWLKLPDRETSKEAAKRVFIADWMR